MTPFQHARAAAVALRVRVFGDRSNDAISSADVISAITSEEAEDFDIAVTHPSDNVLGGADAVLLRGSRQIVVRKDAADDERAFLIAHEIGHWKLHPEGHAACHEVVQTSLKVNHTESFGAQKVEAYGARERAELQANVFARELLLPCSVAASRFQSGETALGLSQILSLPLELVRQQILDGTLLPPPSSRELEADSVVVPTPEQLAAAKSAARVSLLVAGPGTGKTATLVLRVQHLIEIGVRPEDILILTFSNRAARELVERLEHLGIENATDMWAGTFHAFGLEFLRKNCEAFDLTPGFGVADKMAQISLLEPHIYSVPLRAFNPLGDPLDWLHECVKAIQRAKDELAGPEEFLAAVKRSEKEIPSDVLAKQHDVATLYQQYEQVKRATRNLVDLGDLLMLPAAALRAGKHDFSATVGRFKHILVDEYQDVNRASAELVKALAKDADSVWVVGDARQAIYRFRGASMRNIVRFVDDFPKHKTFHLTQNRRSCTEIVRVFEHTGRETHPLQGVLPLEDTQPVRGASGVKPVHIRCENKAIAHGELVARCQELHTGGVAFRHQVVLGSTHDICGAAAEALNRCGVPALHLGDIFQRPEIKDVLTLLQALVDRTGSGLARIARMKGLELAGADVDLIREALRTARPEPMSWLLAPPIGLSPEGQTALYRWVAAFEGLRSSDTPWEVVCSLLLDRTDILRSCLTGNTITDVTRRLALWQLIYYLRTSDGGAGYQTLGGFLTRLRRRLRIGDDRELRIPPPEASGLDAVAIMTIHGSKGLEFDAVHLVDIDAHHFRSEGDSPLVPSGLLESIGPRSDFESETEASNKLYVALSRARNHLYLYELRDHRSPECVAGIRSSLALLHRIEGRAELPPADAAAIDPIAPPAVVDLPGFLAYRVCPRRFYYDAVKALTPSAGLHPAAIIEAAVMRDLFTPHGEEEDATDHLTSAIDSFSSAFQAAAPYLRAYGDQLLANGRKWLGQERAVMAKPFTIRCGDLPLRILPHRVTEDGDSVTLHFARARPPGKLKRQEDVLRWALYHLAQHRRNRLFMASVFVLSTGMTQSITPQRRDRYNDPAAEGILAGQVEARPNAWECPKCRHFIHCPS